MPRFVRVTARDVSLTPVTPVDKHGEARTAGGDTEVLLHSDGHETTSETKSSGVVAVTLGRPPTSRHWARC
ncbi:hypothetical protein GCM10025762_57240 [Haloechinothrix salitolerans]